jgi:hypothetical protein
MRFLNRAASDWDRRAKRIRLPWPRDVEIARLPEHGAEDRDVMGRRKGVSSQDRHVKLHATRNGRSHPPRCRGLYGEDAACGRRVGETSSHRLYLSCPHHRRPLISRANHLLTHFCLTTPFQPLHPSTSQHLVEYPNFVSTSHTLHSLAPCRYDLVHPPLQWA